MGIHKAIRDLNPLVLYTFDRIDTYIDDETTTGYCANRTEFDFPAIIIKNSGLFYKGYNLKPLMPAISEIEQNTKYASFSTGQPSYLTMGYVDNLRTPKAYTFKFNNGSVYADVDYSDQMPLFLSGGNVYTVFLHFSGYTQTFTDPLPLIRIPSELGDQYNQALMYFGSTSVAILSSTDDNNIGLITASFGYMLDADPLSFYMDNGIGFVSQSILTKDENYKPPVEIYPYPHPIYYGSTASNNRFHVIFKFKTLVLYAKRNTDATVGLYIKKSTLQGSTYVDSFQQIISSLNGEIGSLFIIVRDDKNVTIYNNLNTITLTLSNLPMYEGMHIGIKSEFIPSNIKDPLYPNIPLFEISSPTITANIDNVAVYNREITRTEASEIYYMNFNYLSIYRMFGFTQLYDFNDLYTKHTSNKATRYIEDDTTIRNALGGESYLYVQANTDYMPYITKSLSGDFEYVFKCTKYAAMLSRRRSGSYSSNGWPISMIRSDIGTFTFMFRTTDLNGILFANTLYEYNTNNIALIMSYGYLEIWVGNALVSRLSDMATGEWHNVVITFSNNATKFYINKNMYYSHPSKLINQDAMTLFGNGIPGNTDLECDFALIGISNRVIDPADMDIFIKIAKVTYSARGQVTLNNIAISTNIFVYNRFTGDLIEKLQSDSVDGTFTYVNRYPFTVTVVVADSTLINGKSYIVDPVEIE